MRRGRPSLLGTMARTAVVAGTATAVAGRVAGGQQQKAAAAQQQAAQQQAAQQAAVDTQQQMAALQAQQAQDAIAAQTPPTAAPAAGNDFMAQLNQLAQLKTQGLLSEEQFEAAKAKLLGG